MYIDMYIYDVMFFMQSASTIFMYTSISLSLSLSIYIYIYIWHTPRGQPGRGSGLPRGPSRARRCASTPYVLCI